MNAIKKQTRETRARKNQRERERESRRRKGERFANASLSLSRTRRKKAPPLLSRWCPSRVSGVVLFISKQNVVQNWKKKCGSRLETLNPTPTHKRSKGILLLLLLYEDVKNVLVQQHSERALRRGFRPLGVDDLSLGDWR